MLYLVGGLFLVISKDPLFGGVALVFALDHLVSVGGLVLGVALSSALALALLVRGVVFGVLTALPLFGGIKYGGLGFASGPLMRCLADHAQK